jgi:phage-related protein
VKEENINWKFYAYRTRARGREVQEWFDGLEEEEKDEIRDAIGYLQTLPLRLWAKPRYSPLGDGLSEIRIKVSKLNKTFRIYGFFWPEGKRNVYTFLLGRDKKVKNPQSDIAQARKRLKEVEQREVETHEFKFEGRAN